MKKDSFLRAFASQHTILYNRGKKPVYSLPNDNIV